MWPGAPGAASPTEAAAAAAAAAGVTLPPELQNNAAAYAQALQAAAENLPRPAVPAVLNVADRQVCVFASAEGVASGVGMCVPVAPPLLCLLVRATPG
jgi:hypothetical protein